MTQMTDTQAASWQAALRRAARLPRRLALLAALVVVLAAGQGATAEPKDGRINLEAHFGGDALYCVDANRIATNEYFTDDNGGGIRLLNAQGNELWFISSADILTAVRAARDSETTALVGTANGTYGAAALYVQIGADDDPLFTFTGVDEHGKTNALQFPRCDAIGRRDFVEDVSDKLCSVEEVDEASRTYQADDFAQCARRADCGTSPSYECFCDAYPEADVCWRYTGGGDDDEGG